jgi:molybdopterin converting factor small subunit
MNDLIHVRVKLFGPAGDAVGAGELEYGLARPATVAMLAELMYLRHPRLRGMSASVRFAVNAEYADLQRELHEGDEVAVIPPVAGGSM